MNRINYPQNRIVLFTLFLIITTACYAQVGIGNISPHESSLLDIHNSAGDKGVLIPRVNIPNLSSQNPIVGTAAESLLVYNTNTTTGKGFYYWSGSSWIKVSSGSADNLYTADGTLAGNRTISASNNFLQLASDQGRNAFILKRTNNNTEQGIAFQNSDNAYDANIYMQPGTNQGLVFATGGTSSTITNLSSTLTLKNDNGLVLNGYGTGSKSGAPSHILGIDTNGNVLEIDQGVASSQANKDWFKASTTSPPTDIGDNIYTNGNVGINILDPQATFHVYEAMGTVAGPNTGTILLEHGNTDGTGESSIVFKSAINSGSDYGYIKYQDDGSGNGSTTENSLLEIGTSNDGPDTPWQDDININASGSLGINTSAPSPSASLHLARNNQGILINRVALQSRTDTNTIVGEEPDGLLVYNTAPAGTAPNNVVEGFYYWDNAQWNSFNNTGNSPAAGVQYYSYDISNQNAPDIRILETNTIVTKSGGYAGNLNNDAIAAMNPAVSDSDGFAIKIVGTYTVKTAGNFTCKMGTDDGGRIYIDDSLVFNDWSDSGLENPLPSSAAIPLAKGKHQFVFWFYENAGGQELRLEWAANPDGLSGTMKATDFTIE